MLEHRHISGIVVLFAILLVMLMPSGGSIWIDEAQTWEYTTFTSPSGVVGALVADNKSEAQMPLSMFLAWGWSKIIGTS